MIEILFYRSDRLMAQAEADDPEAALLAARTLWDDDRAAWAVQGAEKARRVVFMVDGQMVRMVEGRRP